ncbi:MAG TPA: hypothetical protein VGG38_02750 [Acidimicrobiales bacterium]|jgi:hypothetical protein
MTDHIVDPQDEARHQPDPDDLWNESYYADFVHGDGTWGGWLRLGLYPNRQVAWWTTYIVGADRPGVHSVNYTVPVPAGTGLVAEDAATRIEIDLVDPLKRFRLAATASAEVMGAPEDVYSGTAGTPTELEVDLTWTTDGSPYHYELTTRYEIPCLVSGTVRIGDETLQVDGQGQRDHSWGVRDWWAFGWCWSSARLDDGTRVHLADIRMPGFPVAFGYLQAPTAGDAQPVSSLAVSEEMGQHGFPETARIDIASEASAIGIAVTPVAYGPVLLVNDTDGRISRFPRALVHYQADDGRAGFGWIEWNQPEPA